MRSFKDAAAFSMNLIDEDQERSLPLTSIQRSWLIASTAIPDVNPSRLLAKMSPLEIGSNFGSTLVLASHCYTHDIVGRDDQLCCLILLLGRDA